jgi:hypothetical protein
MRVNHSRLHFLGLIATVTVLSSGVCANAALAGTTASTSGSNGASASPVFGGSSSASGTGPRSLVDGTRAGVGSDRTPRAVQSPTATATTGEPQSPAGGPAANGSTTPSEQVVQATTPSPPAGAAPPTPIGPTPPAGVEPTPVDAGGNSAGAPTGATVPSATATTRPTDRRPTAVAPAAIPVATRLSARHAPAPPRSPTKPESSTPQSTPSPATPSAVTSTVATPGTATNPVATGSVATEPVATPSGRTQTDTLSPGSRTRRVREAETLLTRWLEADMNRRVTPPVSRPDHPSLGLAGRLLGAAAAPLTVVPSHTSPDNRSASVAVAARRHVESAKPPTVGRPSAAKPTQIPRSPVPVVQRLPIGGSPEAAGGGSGSVAPSVVVEFEVLALVFALMLVARFYPEHATWRTTLLASRLERPG